MYPLLCGLMGPENGPRGDAMRIHPIATVYFGVILLCLSKGPFTNPKSEGSIFYVPHASVMLTSTSEASQ